MAALLFGRKYPRTKIGLIELDATVSENHDYSATVTQFPVENGTVISDHIFNNPVRLSLECLISDSPLSNSRNPLVTIASNLVSFFSFNSGPTRSNAIFEDLMRLFDKRELFQVVTGLKLYKNMAITSLSFPRSSGSGQGLIFRIEMLQVKFASILNISYQRVRLIEGNSEPIIREQLGNNENYVEFKNDPVASFKDQGQSFIDVGTQTLQPIKKPALDIVLSVTSVLAASGIYR